MNLNTEQTLRLKELRDALAKTTDGAPAMQFATANYWCPGCENLCTGGCGNNCRGSCDLKCTTDCGSTCFMYCNKNNGQ